MDAEVGGTSRNAAQAALLERRVGHGGGDVVTPPALVLCAAGLSALTLATTGALGGVEPFATWYYPFAWYGTLALGEAVLRRRTAGGFLLSRAGFALFLWSVPLWLLFELVNFRVANWYYVFVPDDPVARWSGIALSFATVLPAIATSQWLLETAGVFEGRRSPSFSLSTRASFALQAVGVSMAALSVAFPTWFFPLVWGSVTLLVDPWVYRRVPQRSLLGHLVAGRPGLVYRLLGGGLVIGLLWELFNWVARSRWIYTVPGLEELKLFEMPVLGFLGFPVLALDGWAVWQALVVAGLAPAPDGRRRFRPVRATVAGVFAVLFSGAVLAEMERHTISSYTPRLEVVAPEASGAAEAAAATRALRAGGYDVFALARTTPREVTQRTDLSREDAEAWIRRARLATLRGIGARHLEPLARAGVRSVEDLAAADPARLAAELDNLPSVTPARVRVWVRGARRTEAR